MCFFLLLPIWKFCIMMGIGGHRPTSARGSGSLRWWTVDVVRLGRENQNLLS